MCRENSVLAGNIKEPDAVFRKVQRCLKGVYDTAPRNDPRRGHGKSLEVAFMYAWLMHPIMPMLPQVSSFFNLSTFVVADKNFTLPPESAWQLSVQALESMKSQVQLCQSIVQCKDGLGHPVGSQFVSVPGETALL